MPARRKNQIDPLELSSGDAVVHSQHGVGRYVEMVQRSVAGSVREYLVIEYAPSRRGHPGDLLYVPMDALDQVTRYVGGENPTEQHLYRVSLDFQHPRAERITDGVGLLDEAGEPRAPRR